MRSKNRQQRKEEKRAQERERAAGAGPSSEATDLPAEPSPVETQAPVPALQLAAPAFALSRLGADPPSSAPPAAALGDLRAASPFASLARRGSGSDASAVLGLGSVPFAALGDHAAAPPPSLGAPYFGQRALSGLDEGVGAAGKGNNGRLRPDAAPFLPGGGGGGGFGGAQDAYDQDLLVDFSFLGDDGDDLSASLLRQRRPVPSPLQARRAQPPAAQPPQQQAPQPSQPQAPQPHGPAPQPPQQLLRTAQSLPPPPAGAMLPVTLDAQAGAGGFGLAFSARPQLSPPFVASGAGAAPLFPPRFFDNGAAGGSGAGPRVGTGPLGAAPSGPLGVGALLAEDDRVLPPANPGYYHQLLRDIVPAPSFMQQQQEHHEPR